MASLDNGGAHLSAVLIIDRSMHAPRTLLVTITAVSHSKAKQQTSKCIRSELFLRCFRRGLSVIGLPPSFYLETGLLVPWWLALSLRVTLPSPRSRFFGVLFRGVR
jgi:hypothetical protein